MKKKKWWVVLYSISIIFLILYVYMESSLPNGKLTVSFLNVGQGDATLITTPQGKRIVIDGGPFSNIMEVLPSKIPFMINSIDVVIVTHPHEDHFEGLLSVMKRYQIGTIILPNVASSEESYQFFLESIKGQNIVIAKSNHDIEIESHLSLDFLSPKETASPHRDMNDDSIVCRLMYGDTSILFTGDIGIEAEKEIYRTGFLVDSDIIKIAHHGSSYASSDYFMQAVSPKTAIISVGKGNTFKHPSFRVLQLLREYDIQYYRTDEHGTIDLVCGMDHDCVVNWEHNPKEFKNSTAVQSS